MRGVVLICFALTLVLCSAGQIDKLGVILGFEKGNLNDLKSYLNNFINPLCDVIQEFNIIIHHEAASEFAQLQTEMKTYQESVPINFYNATSKEAEFKFRIPKNSKADLYYVSNIFSNEETCQQMKDAMALAKGKTISGLFGVIGEKESLTSIQVDLRRKENELFYYDKLEGNHFCLVEDIRLIPRHILELSQSNIKEVAMMANSIQPHCEDIFLNFVSAHFYPELRPTGASFQSSINVESDEYTQYDQKNTCIRKFIDILGYVPVYYQRKEFQGEIWVNPNLPKVIQLKRQQIIMAISKETVQKASARRLFGDQVSQLTQKPVNPFYQQAILNILWSLIAILTLGILIFFIRTRKLLPKMQKSWICSQ